MSAEYESDEMSDDRNVKKPADDQYDDVFLDNILKFTEKEIKKNKELTEENSRKNSAITVNFFYLLSFIYFVYNNNHYNNYNYY